jgi:hypothetical protein
MEYDHMMQARTPNGTNQALDVGSLLTAARRGQHFGEAHVSHLLPEFMAEDGMWIPAARGDSLERGPGLRPRLAAAHHVLAHAALTDVEAKFEQLTVDAGAPQLGFSLDTSCGPGLEPHGKSPVVPVGRGAPSRSRTRESRRCQPFLLSKTSSFDKAAK